jgi:hypothetical protein
MGFVATFDRTPEAAIQAAVTAGQAIRATFERMINDF